VLSVFEASMFNPPHPLDFPTSPQPPLPPQPPRIALSPSVMHAPPSAWPQHHTLLDAPVLNFTLSGPHTFWSSHLSLSLSDTHTHKTTERTTTTVGRPALTHARTQTTCRRRRLAPLPRPLVISAPSTCSFVRRVSLQCYQGRLRCCCH
jgi:hypothetical protein